MEKVSEYKGYACMGNADSTLELQSLEEIPLFRACNYLPTDVKVTTEWKIQNEDFNSIQQYLETCPTAQLVVHASDCVHPYHNHLYDEKLFYLREYFLNHPQSWMVYYSVNQYSVFDGVANIQYHWIPEYHSHYWPVYKSYRLQQITITKKFLCLNKRACFSRWLTYKKFYTDNLLEHSIFSFLGEDERWGTLEQTSIIESFETALRQWYLEFAHLKTPDKMFIKLDSDRHLDFYRKTSYIKTNHVVDGVVDPSWRLDQDLFEKTFCSVIGETSWQADKPNFSEKTFRAICYGHPFILIGAQHSLKFLRDMGFDTYDDVFDNSYDNIENPWKRLLAVFDAIDKINNKSIQELDHLKKTLYTRQLHNKFLYNQLYNKMISRTNQLLIQLKKHVQSKI